MTLIITAISDTSIVQVSDRRLTMPDGSLHDDMAIKAICINCADACFSMAYTGHAYIGGTPTDEWVVNFLTSINAGELGLKELIESLKNQLAITFIKLRQKGQNIEDTFVLAGFRSYKPFWGLLSNMENKKGNRLKNANDDFNAVIFDRNGKALNKLSLVINGAENAIGNIKSEIRNIRKKYFGKSPERIAKVLVQLVRMAADNPAAKDSIGRNCLSTVVGPNCVFVCRDHSENTPPEQHMPHLILKSTAYKKISIWTGKGEPPWWNLNKN